MPPDFEERFREMTALLRKIEAWWIQSVTYETKGCVRKAMKCPSRVLTTGCSSSTEGVWQNTQGSWRDDNADRVASQFWAQFERDIEDYLRALQTLDEAINRARVEING